MDFLQANFHKTAVVADSEKYDFQELTSHNYRFSRIG